MVLDPTGTPKANRISNSRKRPRTQDPGPPDQTKSLARTRTATEQEADAVHIVRRDSDNASVLASPVRRGRPIAHASQAAPCAGRTTWHVMYQCGACGGTHFGRSPHELKTGKRLARCGKVVYLVISRTYRGAGAKQVAA